MLSVTPAECSWKLHVRTQASVTSACGYRHSNRVPVNVRDTLDSICVRLMTKRQLREAYFMGEENSINPELVKTDISYRVKLRYSSFKSKGYVSHNQKCVSLHSWSPNKIVCDEIYIEGEFFCAHGEVLFDSTALVLLLTSITFWRDGCARTSFLVCMIWLEWSKQCKQA